MSMHSNRWTPRSSKKGGTRVLGASVLCFVILSFFHVLLLVPFLFPFDLQEELASAHHSTYRKLGTSAALLLLRRDRLNNLVRDASLEMENHHLQQEVWRSPLFPFSFSWRCLSAVYMPIHLFTHLHLSISLPTICLTICLSIFLSMYLSIHGTPSICLASLCLPTYPSTYLHVPRAD